MAQGIAALGHERSAASPPVMRPSAEALIGRAREIFARIGAPGWMAEADAALARP